MQFIVSQLTSLKSVNVQKLDSGFSGEQIYFNENFQVFTVDRQGNHCDISETLYFCLFIIVTNVQVASYETRNKIRHRILLQSEQPMLISTVLYICADSALILLITRSRLLFSLPLQCLPFSAFLLTCSPTKFRKTSCLGYCSL